MAFNDESQSQFAFRKLNRKGYTDNSKAIGNESESSYVQLAASEIFAETISSTPATAVSAGVAEQVRVPSGSPKRWAENKKRY
jgi:hypothetical protein